MPAGGDDSYDECLIHSGSDAIWGRFCFLYLGPFNGGSINGSF